MPTSKIRSAAQGYIELEGVAKKENMYAPIIGDACVWWHYKVDYREKWLGAWFPKDNEKSSSTFELVDPTGVCLVDPKDAQIIIPTPRYWYGSDCHKLRFAINTRARRGIVEKIFARLFGKCRIYEQIIRTDAKLYVLGDFTSLNDKPTDQLIAKELASYKIEEELLKHQADPNLSHLNWGKLKKTLNRFATNRSKRLQEREQTKKQLLELKKEVLNDEKSILNGERLSIEQPFIISTFDERGLLVQKKKFFLPWLTAWLSVISLMIFASYEFITYQSISF